MERGRCIRPRSLKAAVQCVAAGAGIIDPGHAARFDRIGGHPVNDQALFDDVRRDSEGGIDLGLVAGLVEIGLVIQATVVELRRVWCEGVACRYDAGPRLILDNDAFGGISRLVERIGDNHRDRAMCMTRSNAIAGRGGRNIGPPPRLW